MWIHSPFVYDFCTQVLPRRREAAFGEIEQLRSELANSAEVLDIEDFGAGGAQLRFKQVKVSHLVRRAACTPRTGALLYRICAHYQPQTCIEFGSNLGISTLYQAKALPNATFLSMEGSAALAEKARAHLARCSVQARVITGEFSTSLEQLDLAALRPDYAFIDGNHRYAPTLAYFHRLLPHMPDKSILIFDDIHWSTEMERAWLEITAHPEVSVSIDLYQIGVCCIRRPQAKEHFVLRQ